MEISTVAELVEMAAKAGTGIGAWVLSKEAEALAQDSEALYSEMAERLRVMKESVESGFEETARTKSGLSGGDASRVAAAIRNKTIEDNLYTQAMASAMAAAECNAKMGRIVAAPTAGACGVIPGTLLPAMQLHGISGKAAVLALCCAGAFGSVIARRASLSGAECGCQAEIGSASGMAAAALCEMLGGTPKMCADACAIAIKSCLGLVCDPVAGLVECPCVKRNAIGAVHAVAAAHMALAGVESMVPCDEVIDAMKRVGGMMPAALRETSEGGLACSATAKRIAEDLVL